MFFAALWTALVLFPWKTSGYVNCSADTGGGICPDGNTCCRMVDGSSGCIASDLGKHFATCCDDGTTGCGVGYFCSNDSGDCVEWNTTSLFDPLVSVLPRYHLCRAPLIRELFGLQVDTNSSRLAYYSSHGLIEDVHAEVDMVLIGIHGASRNADDYFCSLIAAVQLQNQYNNVMVIAPRFFADSDDRGSSSFFYWEDLSDGPWRYGADSMGPTQISSYAALDKLVETVNAYISGLKRIVVAGHSSGGQMVQRWSFLTSTWFPGKTKAIVANPSSYLYLNPLRFIGGVWARPSSNDCPDYDKWEWGLGDGGNISVPYRDAYLKNVSSLIEQFGTRRIDYLIGGLDQCNVSKPGWCKSHGLETTCMDNLQGPNRFERNLHYMTSLQRIGILEPWHKQRIVAGVGHDHSLMFQSAEGIESLFGEDLTKIESFG